MPITACVARPWLRVSTRIPPSFAPFTTRSLGHLSAACATPSARSVRATATPATSDRPATSRSGRCRLRESENVGPAAGALCQRRPRRPRPAVCSSAASSTGPVQGAFNKTEFVEVQRPNTRTWTPGTTIAAGSRRSMPASLRGAESGQRPSEDATVHASISLERDRLALIRQPLRLPFAFFASGAAALLFEVLWFRALGRVVGNTVWTGALVLTAFMLGMALGGVLAARWARQIRRPTHAFAAAEFAIAVAGSLLVWALPELEALIGQWLSPLVEHSTALAGLRLLLALAAMLVPTTAMGMTLAFGVRILAHQDTTRALGTLYAANTFGACVAPLLAEYYLIGELGLRGTALVAACLKLLPAAVLSGSLFTLLGAELRAGSENPQPAIGRLTTANTLGAAGGAALAGLVLLPRLGIEASLFLLAAGYALLPALLIDPRALWRSLWPVVPAAAGLLFFPFG